jgi:hypothetical protein
MRYEIKVFAAIAVILGISAIGLWWVSSSEATQLPRHLPKATCSRLHHLHGKALWKHYLWHLCNENRAKYVWISSIVQRESGWNPNAKNPTSSAAGLAQFLSIWYDGKWHFNPYDPILSLRVMVYVWNHPSLGGAGNWAL